MQDLFPAAFNTLFIMSALWTALIFISLGKKREPETEVSTLKRAPAITVLIYSHNNKSVIEDTLKEWRELATTETHLHLIFVDNGSTDGTQNFLRHAKKQHTSIRTSYYLKKVKDTRPNAIKNAYAKYAHYKTGYVLTLDADTTLKNNTLLKNVVRQLKINDIPVFRMNVLPGSVVGFFNIVQRCIAAQNAALRATLRHIPKVPIRAFSNGEIIEVSYLNNTINLDNTYWIRWVSNHNHNERLRGESRTHSFIIPAKNKAICNNRDLHRSVKQKNIGYKSIALGVVALLLAQKIIKLGLVFIFLYSTYLGFTFTTLLPITLLGITALAWLVITLWSSSNKSNFMEKLLGTIGAPSLVIFMLIYMFFDTVGPKKI